MLNLVVGESHALQALNPDGQPATGLTWLSSDTNIVSLSADDPPVLTAVAAGQATITAGSGSAVVTVYAEELPLGTTIWSNPGNGSGVYSVVPAVPSPDGVADVFAFQYDGTVQAIKSDGTTAWTANLEWDPAVPDFQGGLIVQRYSYDGSSVAIAKLDGATGQWYPSVSLGAPHYDGPRGISIYPDGTVLATAGDSDDNVYLVGIDPIAGAEKFRLPVTGRNGQIAWSGWNGIAQPEGSIVAGDGYAYVPYIYREMQGDSCTGVMSLDLMRIGSDGTYDWVHVLDHMAPDCGYGYTSASIITNGDQGVLLSWEADVPQDDTIMRQYALATLNGTTVSVSNGPFVSGQIGPIWPVLQTEDGSFIGTVGVYAGGSWANPMIKFDQTGAVAWTTAESDWQPQIATDDGGVIAALYGDRTQAAQFDQFGGVDRALTQNSYTLLVRRCLLQQLCRSADQPLSQ